MIFDHRDIDGFFIITLIISRSEREKEHARQTTRQFSSLASEALTSGVCVCTTVYHICQALASDIRAAICESDLQPRLQVPLHKADRSSRGRVSAYNARVDAAEVCGVRGVCTLPLAGTPLPLPCCVLPCPVLVTTLLDANELQRRVCLIYGPLSIYLVHAHVLRRCRMRRGCGRL